MKVETVEQDGMSAVLDRAMQRFASKTGVKEESGMSDKNTDKTAADKDKDKAAKEKKEKEEKEKAEKMMAAEEKEKKEKAAKEKKKEAIHEPGGEADVAGHAGSQNESMVDRDDYDSQQEHVKRQQTETNQHAKDGTPEVGTQQDATNFDDKSHPHGGAGGASKLSMKALEAVFAIAGEDPKAAAKLVHLADGFYKRTDDTDLGPPLGGEPESVEEGEDAEESTTPEAAPPEEPAAAPAEPAADTTVPRLQDAVHDRQEQLDIDREVVQELNTVLEEVSASVKPRRTRTAADTGDKGDGAVPPEDEQGESKVPHASTDVPSQTQQDGDPDYTLHDQSKGKSEGTPDTATGQETPGSADTDYVFSMKAAHKDLRTKIVTAVANKAKKDGLSKGQARQVMAAVMEKTAAGKKYKQITKALEALGAMDKKTAADPSQTPIGDQTEGAGGEDSNNYSGDEAGDKSPDETSAGNTEVLESPETKTVTDEANREGDKKHSQDTSGSTVASLLTEKALTGTKAKVSHLERVAETLKGYPDKVAVLGPNAASAKTRVVDLRTKVLASAKAIKISLNTKVKNQEAPEFDKAVTAIKNHVIAANVLMNSAKDLAFIITAAEKLIVAASNKFERVAPAFKLACQMIDYRQIGMGDLPKKVAEFINMSSPEFKVVESTITGIAKTASRKVRRGPNELPTVHTEKTAFGGDAPSNELDEGTLFAD